MKVACDYQAWHGERRPLHLAIGFFDGVHAGHARVIGRARAQAAAGDGICWVVTFDPHPARVLLPERTAPSLLTALPHKLRLIERLGVDGCLVLPFTRALSHQTPDVFFERLRAAAPSLASITVGANWRFGKDRQGTPARLAALARPHGIRVRPVPPVARAGGPISSTRLRGLVQAGDLDAAARLLGRPFSVLGTVRPGNRLGHRLGYATANLDTAGDALPPYGIYAAYGLIGHELREGVVSYGVRPTVHRGRHAPAVLEFHVFDFAGDLYGREIEVFLVRKLRDEKTFDSLETLCAHIDRDIAETRRLLGRRKSLKESLYTFCRGVL